MIKSMLQVQLMCCSRLKIIVTLGLYEILQACKCMSSIIGATSDINNTLLSRREITCDFAGLGGKLGRLDAIKMVSKEYGLEDKTVIPMRLKNHVGRTTITGLFYVYEDEVLARKHIDPIIFTRLEKSKAKAEEAANAAVAETTSDTDAKKEEKEQEKNKEENKEEVSQ